MKRRLARRSFSVGGGFTLVELLITMAVAGILAAITFMAFDSAKTKSQIAIGKAALSSLPMAMAKCGDSNNGKGAALTPPNPGHEICTTPVSINWPVLGTNWAYNPTSGTPTPLSVLISRSSYSISATFSGSGGGSGTCTINGCTFSFGTGDNNNPGGGGASCGSWPTGAAITVSGGDTLQWPNFQFNSGHTLDHYYIQAPRQNAPLSENANEYITSDNNITFSGDNSSDNWLRADNYTFTIIAYDSDGSDCAPLTSGLLTIHY